MGFFASSGILNRRGFFGGAAAFSPTSIAGLKLWLKADAGVTESPTTFISQIVLTNAGESTSNGTYTRASGGINGFDGPNNNLIYWDGDQWVLNDDTYQNLTYSNSDLDEGNWQELYASGAPSATNTTSNGPDVVTAWADQSDEENNLSIEDGSPVLEQDVINGKPAIKFNSGRLVGNDIVTAKTIYAVVRTLNYQPYAYAAILEVTGGSLYSAVSSHAWGSYFNGEYAANTAISENTSAIIASLSDDGENYTFRLNGQIDKSDSDGGGFYSRSDLYVGSDSSGGQQANVYISEILVFDDVIGAEDIANLETYLNDKYAIY